MASAGSQESMDQPDSTVAMIELATAHQRSAGDVKLYKGRCTELSTRCFETLKIVQAWASHAEVEVANFVISELIKIIRRIAKYLAELAIMTKLKIFLHREEVKEKLDGLWCDFDALVKMYKTLDDELRRCLEVLFVCSASSLDSQCDQEERTILEDIIRSQQDVNELLRVQSWPLEIVMESLQAELRKFNAAEVDSTQAQVFRRGLWILYRATGKLPPNSSLTGQVRMKRTIPIQQTWSSTVFLGEWLDQELTTLHFPNALAKNLDARKQFEYEVKIWRSFNHPNIVPVLGSVVLGKYIYAVRPALPNGTVVTYLEANPTVDRLSIIHDVASGLEFLHLNGVIQGGFSRSNVMINSEGTAKLSDFGLGQFFDETSTSATSLPLEAPWLPPELLQQPRAQWSIHSDTWLFAILSLEILTGQFPLPGSNRDVIPWQSGISHNRIPVRPVKTISGLHGDLWTLMLQCWHMVPQSRPSMATTNKCLADIRASPPLPASSAASHPQESVRPRRATDPLRFKESTYYPAVSRHSRSARSKVDSPGVQPLTRHELLLGPQRSSSPTHPDHPVDISPKPASLVEVTSYGGDSLSLFTRSRRHSNSSGQNSTLSSLSLPHLADFVPKLAHPSSSGGRRYSSPSIAPFGPRPAARLSPRLRAAVSNPKSIIRYDEVGSVVAGTLEGLVEGSIQRFHSDLSYREILFTSYSDFTSLKDMFNILVRRFTENGEESDTHLSTDRIQENILGIMHHWLINRYLHLDSQLLRQIRNFCDAVGIMGGTPGVESKVEHLCRLIDERLNHDLYASTPLSPDRRVPRPSEILPQDLAFALTLIEGDKYKVILPSDYIAHLEHQGTQNNVQAACLTNNDIVLWVKQSVLHYDTIKSRGQVLKFFVHTALECQRLHNFASLTAIANALTSAPIERLRLTKKELPQALRQALDDFEDLLDPSSNHRTYRAALREVTADGRDNTCIPWIAVHLRELFSVLQKHPPVVEVNGVQLINFERYRQFTARMKEVLHYVPPDLERHRKHGELGFLQQQLRGIYAKPHSDEDLMERSVMLEAEEERDYRTRKRELKRLGFKTS